MTDDLLDIYRDLTPGLAVIQSGTPEDVADAVWHWRFLFSIHWGDHATDALRALHRAMQDTGVHSLNSPQTLKPGQGE